MTIVTHLLPFSDEADTRTLRIGPNELHIDDVHVYDEIYSQKYRFLKAPVSYAGFNAPYTAFTEIMPAAHKVRRKMIHPFFSKQGIVAVQPLLYNKVNLMMEKIRAFEGKEAVHLYGAVRCLTIDIISEFSFGQSFDTLENIKDHSFRPELLSVFDLVSEGQINFHYFPILRAISRWTPVSLISALSKKMGIFQQLHKVLNSAKSSFDIAQAEGKKFERLPLFDPLSSLSPEDLLAEAQDIIFAGSDTTATSLGYLLNSVLSNPSILQHLRAELDANLPDKCEDWPLLKLENLPYLTACVKETLRCALPVPGRLPRVVPSNGPGAPAFAVGGKVIPPGSIVGLSATTMHYNEEIWGSDSKIFRPERWLGSDSKHLDKFLATFGKGGRQCLGINLAYAELRIATAKLFRCLEMDLDKSMTKRDLNQLDCFTSSFEGTGVRAFIRGERE
ncbi:hypothetical protein VTL71DRAFT_12289 [Oculimacula yallundae]|uniref:Cytochrome P450 n=1 Tax=Oculimacula yallundae TaxID=86028 RepID=A0ABR4CMP5_9HELO